MNIFQDWPEPIVRVQSLSESNHGAIPNRYVKPLSQRPNITTHNKHNPHTTTIPIIDLGRLYTDDLTLQAKTLDEISKACREWGFFQVVNHGMSPQLMDQAKATWREFFYLPMELKNIHANSPKTYEGYGSRLGVEKGAILDWSDYYYLHYQPSSLKDYTKWPSLPLHCREIVEDYCKEMVKLCEKLMKILSKNLGLQEDRLQNAFGGKEESGGCLRVNYYPKCPQPELTLGISPHSDPGGLTILLPDEQVAGLQVRGSDDAWITVEPAPHAFIVNIGDQIQMLSNSIYKSVEHRVIVSPANERLSLAFFYNPKGNVPIEPLKEIVTVDSPALYSSTTYDRYRQFIRTQGPRSKCHIDELKSPR
ncbi:Oxoglutarate/iron-dependent dioxygenase [Arabidopsis thaliana x Arabidopsis arenosa]|uniref:Oxoglutarate/iron-dependent dioxygenase n=1 Tax=Arabidopsis thaliana x Arabidopsis arenosa TaxID=1240361 RepID=A0A8T1ZQW8_9BRAS|nr:Oxoglutarate/iron-dependent dioxygenase [Arabidopsis thaliana x Arabidopsis arenosa]